MQSTDDSVARFFHLGGGELYEVTSPSAAEHHSASASSSHFEVVISFSRGSVNWFSSKYFSAFRCHLLILLQYTSEVPSQGDAADIVEESFVQHPGLASYLFMVCPITFIVLKTNSTCVSIIFWGPYIQVCVPISIIFNVHAKMPS